MSKYERKRVLYIDALKILAIVFVIFIHTNENGYTYFFLARNSSIYPISLFISAFVKIAVPLFFMTSGVLLIPREEKYTAVLKRFFRFFIVLITASLISYAYIVLRRPSHEYSIKEFIRSLYSSGVIVPYWYLYAYLAYVLMLPLLRKMAQNMSNSDFHWMMAMYMTVALITVVDYMVFKGKYLHNSNFSLFIRSSYVFYPLLGYYLEHRVDEKLYTGKRWLLLGIAGLICVCFCALLTHIRCSSLDIWKENDLPFFNLLFMAIPASAVFTGIKKWFMHRETKPVTSRVITEIAGTTFGIYLIEQILRKEFIFILNWLKTLIHPYIACWIWVLILSITGGLIIFIIRLIPGVKKYI